MGNLLQKLFNRQRARATAADGTLDVELLARSVCQTYDEYERDRQRVDRANALMAEELGEASARLAGAVDSLSIQNRRFEAALAHMSQGLCMFDREQRVVVCNERFARMFGFGPPQALVGARLTEHIAGFIAGRGNASAGDDAFDGYASLAASAERTAWNTVLTDGSAVLVAHEPMSDGGFVQTFEDVTERHEAQRRIVHLATHDVLTDLPNRLLLRERLQAALAARPPAPQAVVMCLDLDRFKPVNDAFGHAAGDELLRQVTQRLRECVRPDDTVARLGGDEFALVLRGIATQEHATRLAQRILQSLCAPFHVAGNPVQIGASIGIAFARRDADDPDRLINCADLALYDAKKDGRSKFRYFAAEMERSARERRALEADLRQAIDREEFEVHYQPLLELRSATLSGFEALVRWNSPTRGRVAPDAFIPLAEELGLIGAIGDWVLLRACEAALRWPAHVRIAVNVSARQISDSSIVASVDRVLAQTKLDPRRLELEITESVLLNDEAGAMQILHRLRERGIGIVMDDFGTGYSSLAYLRRFPFDKVKIDRSFVSGLGEQADAMAIVRAITGLCASLGIPSTAEGVETPEQLRLLERELCTQGQGFLFGRPQPEQDLAEMLKRFGGDDRRAEAPARRAVGCSALP